ncbi:hypothetical protein WS71_19610 [Burkholderia mayonis]|uniref:Uncharacterized protein n=1 Tax=Burkholderia mayonis TaxID=1385591 RepID=A0A1B4G0U8_9BURK|nr:hypothetical protein WS71_19610 [Burkholderia mayonis]KVE55526.1 hypothetical protein WS71_31375 [Burkholderia mayonis]
MTAIIDNNEDLGVLRFITAGSVDDGKRTPIHLRAACAMRSSRISAASVRSPVHSASTRTHRFARDACRASGAVAPPRFPPRGSGMATAIRP